MSLPEIFYGEGVMVGQWFSCSSVGMSMTKVKVVHTNVF